MSVMSMIGNPNGMSFFNGSVCPVAPEPDFEFKVWAKSYILKELQTSSLQQIGDVCMERMEYLEGTLFNTCKQYNNISTPEAIKQWVLQAESHFKNVPNLLNDLLGPDELCDRDIYFGVVWYIYVYVLLKLKRIPNDNEYGMVFINST